MLLLHQSLGEKPNQFVMKMYFLTRIHQGQYVVVMFLLIHMIHHDMYTYICNICISTFIYMYLYIYI